MKNSARAIDHLVLPVADIDTARARFAALGFTVAPNGVHPFGTENACVFFKDGTFLEPLAIGHRETCEAAAAKGNTFVINDQAYRFRRGHEGFSHLVLKTGDASADHKAWTKAQMSGGRMVRFGRTLKTPTGEKGRVSFKLAFASDPWTPDADFFSCEVVSTAQVDRTPLMAHANGAVRLMEVVIAEPNPSDFQYFLQGLFNQRHMDNHSFGIELEAANARVTALTPAGMKAFYGLDTEPVERGMRLTTYVIGVTSLAETKKVLAANKVEGHEIAGRFIVPHAPGQGTALAFQEVSA